MRTGHRRADVALYPSVSINRIVRHFNSSPRCAKILQRQLRIVFESGIVRRLPETVSKRIPDSRPSLSRSPTKTGVDKNPPLSTGIALFARLPNLLTCKSQQREVKEDVPNRYTNGSRRGKRKTFPRHPA